MQLTNRSTVPVYTISGSDSSRQLPEWLARKRKHSLKRDPEFANRVELLQDFGFEEASQCIRVSEDGDWVVSTGTYKPQIHVHSLSQLSLSFSRHTNALNHSFELLSSDYSKSIHLQDDRSLEFHTPGGCHYTTRIPRYGRDLKYDRRSAEAVIPSVGVDSDGKGEVFRVNLELGRFMRSYELDVGGDDKIANDTSALQGGIATGAVNCASLADSSHGLLAFGTSRGTIEFFDPRAKARVAFLHPPADPLDSYISSADTPSSSPQTTAIQFHPSGLTIASGSSTGLIHLFDMRSSRPLLEKDHGYGYPVQTLKFLTSSSTRTSHLSSEPKVLSADKRIIKLWDAQDGSAWTSVEPTVDLNCVEWISDTGMILTANEGRQQHAFFIPQLGPAPRWCNFIDNMVEEMAEDPDDPNAYENTALQKSGEIYDNYKFLTQSQLQALNIEHLVGTTGMIRPYMHGYFVQQQLYEEARLVAQPETWAEERNKRIRERIEKERESRIRGSKRINVKVNKGLAEKLAEREKKNQQRKAKRAIEKANRDKAVADGDADVAMEDSIMPDDEQIDEAVAKNIDTRPSLLTDERFGALFTNPEYAIDEQSAEFRALNASTKIQKQNKDYQRELAKGSGLTAVEQEEIDSGRGVSSSDDEESNAEPETNYHSHRKAYSKNSRKEQRKPKPKPDKRQANGVRREPQMHVSSSGKVPISRSTSDSFGSRLAQGHTPANPRRQSNHAAQKKANNVVGEKQMTFTVSNGQKHKQTTNEGDGANDQGRPQRRNKDRRSASGNTFRRM